MSLARTDDSVHRERAAKASDRLLASLRRHHGEGEPAVIAPVPFEPLRPLPPIPNAVIAGACRIAFPPAVLNQVEAIQRAVVQEFPGITMADLKSDRRTAKVAFPRQIGMFIAKTVSLRSLPEIGRRFGGRDHTTVLHAVRKIEGLIAKDPELSARIERIKDNIPEIRI